MKIFVIVKKTVSISVLLPATEADASDNAELTLDWYNHKELIRTVMHKSVSVYEVYCSRKIQLILC